MNDFIFTSESVCAGPHSQVPAGHRSRRDPVQGAEGSRAKGPEQVPRPAVGHAALARACPGGF